MNDLKILNLEFNAVPSGEQDVKTLSGYKTVKYGLNNDYPQYLYDVYQNYSPKHSAIINRKANMIGGQGFNKEGITKEATQFLNNPYVNQSIDDVVRMASYDLEVLYYITLEITYSRDMQSVASVTYLPSSRVRFGIVTDEIPFQHFLYSKNWGNTRKKGNEVIVYPAFSRGENGVAKELLYIPFYQGYSEYYPSPTTEEKDEWYDDFSEQYLGSKNAGNPVITYSQDQESSATLTPLDSNDSADRFTQLSETVLQNILIGHEVTNPELFGVMIPGKLGNSDLYESLDVFQAIYINARQKVINDAIQMLFNFNNPNDTSKLELTPFKLKKNEE